MSTRRLINKAMKGKNLNYTAEYDGSGANADCYGWWVITLDKESADFVRTAMNEHEFTGVIEFCEVDEGIQQLNELPKRTGGTA